MRDRLLYTLAAAGVPVDTCPVAVGPSLLRSDLTFVGTPSQAQLSTCDSVLSAFDWSAAAQAAWEAARLTDAAKAVVMSDNSPFPRAARAGCVALMLSLQECRTKVNEVVAWANGQGASIAPLVTGASISEAFGDVILLLDAGVV